MAAALIGALILDTTLYDIARLITAAEGRPLRGRIDTADCQRRMSRLAHGRPDVNRPAGRGHEGETVQAPSKPSQIRERGGHVAHPFPSHRSPY
ncbi:hypothetical protein [Streptomyces sp. NPDC091371]|uniref:hypothetical protein n=1 Tax=Streptomyces sp. NPDC091371 TaxID=3155303 RepID=UPI00341340AD